MFELDLPWDLHEVCKVPAAEEFSLAEELRMIEMSFRGSNNILSEKIKQDLSLTKRHFVSITKAIEVTA